MELTRFDKNIVSNLRATHGDKLKPFTDKQIAAAWGAFSVSEDYGDMDKFPLWPEGFDAEGIELS